MLDIGVYALSIVRSFMDKKPEEVVSQRKVSPTGSDEQATILLKNDCLSETESSGTCHMILIKME